MNIVEESWSMKHWFRKLPKCNFHPLFFSLIPFKKFRNRIWVGFLKNLALFYLVFLPNSLFAYFQFDANCVIAYQKIWNLELIPAGKLINKERLTNPGNRVPVLLDNYIHFLTVFTSETPNNYEDFKKNCAKNLDILNKESQTQTPLYLFSIGQIHLQSALIRARFQDYWSAAFELRKAYSNFEKNSLLYPDFVLNPLNLGTIQSLLGNLPSNVKFLLSPLGLKGNLNEGLSKVELNLKRLKSSNLSFFSTENLLYYTFICSNLDPNRKTFNELVQITETVSDRSLLKTYIISAMAMKKFQNDFAINTLKNRETGNEYSSFYYLDYLLGLAYINRLDTSGIYFLKYFIKNSPSSHFKKDALLRLGWAQELCGREEMAKKIFLECLAPEFNIITERDKQAIKDAEKGIPNISLLKARLLFDGGYFDSAMRTLNNSDSAHLKLNREKLEFTYRKARIFEAQGKLNQAIYLHKKTYDMGKLEPYYFSANSSLHLGLIYENLKKNEIARTYFLTCLEMNEKEYKGSIDQEAQNELNRLK